MEEIYMFDVEPEGYRVTSLAMSIRLFKMLEATAIDYAEDTGLDTIDLLPVFRLDI